MSGQKTILITGESQEIGAGLVKAFRDKSWNVVGTSRRISNTTPLDRTARLELVDGDVGDPATAERVAHRAVDRFGSIDALVNNAGIEGSSILRSRPSGRCCFRTLEEASSPSHRR